MPQRPLRILDAGGGFGFFSQKLAALGHQVVLCDLSADMLDEAARQLAEQGLSDRVRLIHCAIQDLPAQLEGEFDLILCHAVITSYSIHYTKLYDMMRVMASMPLCPSRRQTGPASRSVPQLMRLMRANPSSTPR